MAVSLWIAKKKIMTNQKHVVHLIWMAIFTTVCYTAFILVPSDYPTLATFAAGVYFLSTDWLVVYLMLFAAAYTQVSPPSKVPRIIIGMLAGVDSISFLINTFTCHMFELEAKVSKSMRIKYWFVLLKTPHVIHRVFVYAIVLYSLWIFTYRLIKAPKIYKNKYGSVLLQTLAVVGLNILCSAMDAKFDYSVILYASLAISICYLTLYASPKKLLERIHSTIVGDSVIGMFAYDNNGKCVGANRMAKELFGEDQGIFDVAEAYLVEWQKEYKDNQDNVIGEERKIIRNGSKL